MENNYNIEQISKGIISFMEFSKNLKNTSQNQIIINQDNTDSFIFRKFNSECYIIEKKILDDFLISINFNELTKILDLLTDENKNKFDKELEKYLEQNPLPNCKNIKIYSELEKMKEIIQNFDKYTFVNEEFLCNVMNVNPSLLKNKAIKISKNEKNTCLVSVAYNYFINYNNYIFGEIEDYKNLYYVEDLTKKIFILFYFNEIRMKDKLKEEIKDFYNFKNYYLINKDWFEKYKNFFCYDIIIKKLENLVHNDNETKNNQNNHTDKRDNNYSYKKVKYILDDICYSIGQIRLYNETKISNELRNAKELIPQKKKILIKKKKVINDEYQLTEEPEIAQDDLNIPYEFYIINQDIFELLIKEKFFYNMNKDIIDELKYEILIGNNNHIIKNKPIDSTYTKYNYYNEFLIYIDKNKISFSKKDYSKELKDPFILYYILNYNKNKNEDFFNDLKILNKKNGLREYIKIRKISQQIDNINFEEDIKDSKGNILGKFINIKIDKNCIMNKNEIIEDENDEEEKIKNENIKKNEIKNKEKEFKINIENKRKDKNEFDIKMKFNDRDNDKQKNSNENDVENKREYENLIKKIQDKKNNNININKEDKNEENIEKKQEYNIINNRFKDKDSKKIIKEKELPKDYEKIINFLKEKENEIKKLFIMFNENISKGKIKINFLNPKEIKKIEKNLIEILLISEERLNKLKSFFNYNIILEYFKLKDTKIKDNYLKENIQIFNNFNKFNNNFLSISEDCSLIETYEDCIKCLNKGDKFYLIDINNFNKNLKKLKSGRINYFSYQNNSYLFFSKEEKIIQLKDAGNNFWNLIKFNENQKDSLDNIMKNLFEEINENKKVSNIKKYLLPKYKDLNDIKYFYFINDDWLDFNLKKNDFNWANFRPDFDKYEEKYNYPSKFRFIEKEKENLINQLIDYGKINDNDIYINKLIFVKGKNNIKNNSYYFGLFDANIIYFYFFENKSYKKFDFFVKYNDTNSMPERIKEINSKGIEAYLYELGIDLTKIGKQSLIDDDFNIIGEYFSLNDKLINEDISAHSKPLKNVAINYYNGVIQCLVNIHPLKTLFLNKNKLMNICRNPRINDKPVTFNFYLLMKYIWNNDINDELKENTFLAAMKSLSKDINIFNNIKLLIEFILLSIHYESYTNISKIVYKLDYLRKNINSTNQSFIKDLFFFNILSSSPSKCCNKIIESSNYILYYNKNNISKLYGRIIGLNNLFHSEINFGCDCKSHFQSKLVFKTLPKILIIILELVDDYQIKFNYNQSIDITEFVSPKSKPNCISKYELISLIIYNKNPKKIRTYCKSLNEEKIWYKYEESISQQNCDKIHNFNKIQLNKDLPFLLVYKNLGQLY